MLVVNFVEYCRVVVAVLLQYNFFIINIVEYVENVEHISARKISAFTRIFAIHGIKQKGAVSSTLTKQNKLACLFL